MQKYHVGKIIASFGAILFCASTPLLLTTRLHLGGLSAAREGAAARAKKRSAFMLPILYAPAVAPKHFMQLQLKAYRQAVFQDALGQPADNRRAAFGAHHHVEIETVGSTL